ncbi:MAG: hypothetical protein K6F77_05355 [Lachnospiraceae bacterium]|nr:hypothetical protein [Lachnospiraceae bacterium]
MKKFLIFLGIIGLIAGMFAIAFFTIKIDTVTTEGNSIYSDEQIIKAQMSDKYSYNTLYSLVKFKVKGMVDMPFAERIVPNFEGPKTLKLKVYEKSINACVYAMNQYAFLDDDGVVVDCLPTTLSAITVITGVDVNSIEVGKELDTTDKNDLPRLINLTTLIKYYNINVKKLTNKEKCIIMETDNVTVKFANKDHYDDEMAALSSTLKKIRKNKLSGTIDMTDFVSGDKIILKSN